MISSYFEENNIQEPEYNYVADILLGSKIVYLFLSDRGKSYNFYGFWVAYK